MILLKALCICEYLAKAIASGRNMPGKIHSVFDNACNIEAGGNFITLLGYAKSMAPMSAVIDNKKAGNFKTLDLSQGLYIEFHGDKIICPGKGLLIDLTGAKTWSPEIEQITNYISGIKVLKNLEVMEQGLLKYGNHGGAGKLMRILSNSILDIDPMLEKNIEADNNIGFIENRFLAFIDSFILKDNNNISTNGSKIIGFGPGLTPSMDDFISGLMITSYYMASYYNVNLELIKAFNQEIIKLALEKTTKVSSEMLRHAASGRTTQNVKVLLETILTKENQVSIIKALRGTIDYGETSGTDTALGIYVGLKIWTNFNNRRVWLNETMC